MLMMNDDESHDEDDRDDESIDDKQLGHWYVERSFRIYVKHWSELEHLQCKEKMQVIDNVPSPALFIS